MSNWYRVYVLEPDRWMEQRLLNWKNILVFCNKTQQWQPMFGTALCVTHIKRFDSSTCSNLSVGILKVMNGAAVRYSD